MRKTSVTTAVTAAMLLVLISKLVTMVTAMVTMALELAAMADSMMMYIVATVIMSELLKFWRPAAYYALDADAWVESLKIITDFSISCFSSSGVAAAADSSQHVDAPPAKQVLTASETNDDNASNSTTPSSGSLSDESKLDEVSDSSHNATQPSSVPNDSGTDSCSSCASPRQHQEDSTDNVIITEEGAFDGVVSRASDPPTYNAPYVSSGAATHSSSVSLQPCLWHVDSLDLADGSKVFDEQAAPLTSSSDVTSSELPSDISGDTYFSSSSRSSVNTDASSPSSSTACSSLNSVAPYPVAAEINKLMPSSSAEDSSSAAPSSTDAPPLMTDGDADSDDEGDWASGLNSHPLLAFSDSDDDDLFEAPVVSEYEAAEAPIASMDEAAEPPIVSHDEAAEAPIASEVEAAEAPIASEVEAAEAPVVSEYEAAEAPIASMDEAEEPPIVSHDEAAEAPIASVYEAAEPPIVSHDEAAEAPIASVDEAAVTPIASEVEAAMASVASMDEAAVTPIASMEEAATVASVASDANDPAEAPVFTDDQAAMSSTPNTMTAPDFGFQGMEVLKCLGYGTFGMCLLVVINGTLYALKVLTAATEAQKAETRREREILERLRGLPTVMQLFGATHQLGKDWFLSELGVGGSLKSKVALGHRDLGMNKKMQDFKGLRPEDLVFYGACIVKAVSDMHSRNVVHFDLKLDNIVITEEGLAKVIDLGLAEELMPGETVHACKGTPSYMSPEVAREGLIRMFGSGAAHQRLMMLREGGGRASDWWSVGIVLYEMAFGLVSPYLDYENDGRTVNIARTLIKTVHTRFERLSLPVKLSGAFKSLLVGLLDPNPRTRLGAEGCPRVEEHPFFAGIDFNDIEAPKNHRFRWHPDLRKAIHRLPHVVPPPQPPRRHAFATVKGKAA